MQQWFGIGNLGADPILRTTKSGKSVCNFTIAVDRHYFHTDDKGNRVKVSTTDWIPIACWGSTAETMSKYLRQGSRICVRGRLQPRTYEDPNGVTHHSFDVVASEIQYLDKIHSPDKEQA